MVDISNDQDKVVYELYIYSIEEQIYLSVNPSTSDDRIKDNGGYTSRELDVKYANIFSMQEKSIFVMGI